MPKLYHLTPSDNLESIRKFGLIPKFRRGLTGTFSKKEAVVWLTDNPRYIIETQAGSDWCEKKKAIVIEVETDGLELIPHSFISPTDSSVCLFASYEHKVESQIDPNRIGNHSSWEAYA